MTTEKLGNLCLSDLGVQCALDTYNFYDFQNLAQSHVAMVGLESLDDFHYTLVKYMGEIILEWLPNGGATTG